MQSKEEINLLWTGGWDSTFQLLRLLLLERVAVQPYYLIDVNRKSTALELKAMQRIKEKLFEQHPYTRELLKDTKYYGVQDLELDEAIDQAFQDIRSQRHLGSQYQWLARFCKQYSLAHMQIGVEKRDTTASYFMKMSKTTMDLRSKNEQILFSYFDFPLLYLSKTDMKNISDKNDWNELMKLTWFCHSPTWNKYPCGKCTPCKITMKEGHGSKIPLPGKVNYYFHKLIIWPIKSLKKQLYTK